MKLYKQEANSKVKMPTFIFVEEAADKVRISLVDENGKLVKYLFDITDRGIKLYGSAKPPTDVYEISEEMFGKDDKLKII